MITIKKLFVTVALTALQQYACAANYYVDSELGNDSWSGKLPAAISIPSPDGPWQSLNRLATATLSPGDVVELKCGSRWIQTLRLKNSGTLERPIVIRSGSSTCGTPPSIDGGQTIDAHSWIRHDNTIYKASWPIQKFQNGTLATGIAGWTSWSASADQKLLYESSCPDSSSGCAAFTSSAKPGSIIISNDFLMEGGVTYSGELSLRIPSGLRVKILVRRGSSPYEGISAVQWITGTSAWQKISFAFLARTTVPNARLDIEVPDAGVKVHFKNASLTPAFATPIGAWIGDLPLLPAYHPNRGHDVTRPSSVYAIAAKDSNAVPINNNAGTGSSYVDIDPALKLPQGVTPKAGNRLRIRSAPWNIDEVTVTQVVGTRLYFEPATRYQIRAGQGYFLLDELGMLDSPGEWFYDPGTESTYAWTPDSNAPSDQIRLSVLEKGVDLSGLSNIRIEGIGIYHTGLGIDLTKAQNITVNAVKIKKTLREGIIANQARNLNLTGNQLYRTGSDAISASGATTLDITNNDITESAVAIDVDRVWSLPVPTYAAIFAGRYANVTGNSIKSTASNGIWVLASDGIVERNAVLSSCFQTNDCGGIYVNYSAPNTRIAFNLVERVNSNVDGVISSVSAQAVGIYLDNYSTNMVVENNTVAWADYGIQVHDSYSNRITGNLLHGNRNSQLWFQEQTNNIISTGDVQNNEVSKNRFFPTTSSPSVTIDGAIGSLTHFGVLSENYYSSLFSKRVVSEFWPGHNYAYTLSEWLAASSGQGRVSQDVQSAQLSQDGYAAYLAAGGNIVLNGGLKDGIRGWTSWNATAPLSTTVYEICSLGPCLRITAGGSATLASTPNFSVESGRAYRVTFDAKTGIDGQFIAPLARRGGPLYERLMPASQGFTGSTEWRRYTFVFTAAKTVNAGDPATGDLGARIDFENIFPGQILWLANLEIVPLQAIENTLRTQFIANRDRVTHSRDCPDRETAPEYCDRYHIFPEGTSVSWPIDLPPLGAVSLYTINQSTRDSDKDGIADSQDQCSSTPTNYPVNAAGCALAQIPGQ